MITHYSKLLIKMDGLNTVTIINQEILYEGIIIRLDSYGKHVRSFKIVMIVHLLIALGKDPQIPVSEEPLTLCNLDQHMTISLQWLNNARMN